jgi:putative dimethyl sulfoxide reductase chaperone
MAVVVMGAAPSPQTLRTLALLLGMPHQDALSAIEDLAKTYPWLQQVVEELRSIPLEHWQAEHTRLFLSGYPKTVCPPFESAYRHGRMDGPVCSELEQLYRQVGLAPVKAPADYLGTLLECAAYLSEENTPHAAELSVLWDEHLRGWLPDFSKALIKHSRLQLYRNLGKQLAALVE